MIDIQMKIFIGIFYFSSKLFWQLRKVYVNVCLILKKWEIRDEFIRRRCIEYFSVGILRLDWNRLLMKWFLISYEMKINFLSSKNHFFFLIECETNLWSLHSLFISHFYWSSEHLFIRSLNFRCSFSVLSIVIIIVNAVKII